MKKILQYSCFLLAGNMVHMDVYGLNHVFEAGHFDQGDMRVLHWTPPMPLVYNYENANSNRQITQNGGTVKSVEDLSSPYEYLYITNILQRVNCPQGIQQTLNALQVTDGNLCVLEVYVECATADDKRQYAYNWFSHTWAMDKMIENRNVFVGAGVWDANNIVVMGGDLGANGLIEQSLSFHDGEYLSGNVCKFKIGDLNEPADGWFVSYYDPDKNKNCGNRPENQQKKAIVMHVFFITPGFENLKKNEVDAIRSADMVPDLKPQFPLK